MTREELSNIIRSHELWLKGDANGKRADLCRANLREADLRYTNLYAANLREADLREADLRRADLCGANLCAANLCEANLCEANLYAADLCEANLCEANLYAANLRGARNIPILPQTIVCPEEGSFVGFKKVNDKYIVKLEIPAEAKHSSATTRKCRCEFAKVLSITNLDGTDADLNEIINTNYNQTVYRLGEMVYPDSFDEDRWNECSHGIHFFITRHEAVEY